MAFTPSAHRVDSHCKVMKPSHNVLCADLSTQVISRSYCEAAVGPDLDLSQENSKKIKEIPKFLKKILEIPSPLPMVICWTPPCMLLLWPSPSVLLEKRHSWRQFTWRTGMISPWMDYSLLRDWPITVTTQLHEVEVRELKPKHLGRSYEVSKYKFYYLGRTPEAMIYHSRTLSDQRSKLYKGQEITYSGFRGLVMKRTDCVSI